MEIILREDVHNVGQAGEVVKVKDGYARNCLLPQGKAVQANPSNLQELEHHKRVAQARMAKLKQKAQALADQITGLSLTIKWEAGEGDKLFGAVTNKDIAEALRQEKILIDRKQIHLPNPIKELGVFEVAIRLDAGVTTQVKIWIVKA